MPSKRQVPGGKSPGGELPLGESIGREDYKSTWPSRSRSGPGNSRPWGQQPAVLLVYGIPLRMDDPLFSHWFNQDQEFLSLAQSKVQELTNYAGNLNFNWMNLLGQSKTSADRPPSPQELIRLIQETLRAGEYSFSNKILLAGVLTPKEQPLPLNSSNWPGLSRNLKLFANKSSHPGLAPPRCPACPVSGLCPPQK